MTALRATAYILTSLASVAFLLLVGFGAVQYLRFQDALWPPGTVASDEVGAAHGCAAGPPPPPACVPETPTLRTIDRGVR